MHASNRRLDKESVTFQVIASAMKAMVFARATTFFGVVFGLSALLATAAPPPVTHCDGVNCFVILPPTSSGHEPQQLEAAAPAKLLKLQMDKLPHFAPTHTDCKTPAPLNASACAEQGLPCASMGKSFFFSPASDGNPAGPASCSGAFISNDTVLTAGHCCMPLVQGWVSDVFFYLDYDDGQFSGAYAPTEMFVPEHWSNFTDRRYDWCFMKMNDTAPKHLKTTWSFDPSQFSHGFSAFGWPSDNPYDGKTLYEASGLCRGTSPVFPPSSIDPCDHMPNNPAMMYMTCNTLNDGGGPWYDSNIGMFGISSAAIQAPGQPEIFASPYLGTDYFESCQRAGACN
jgi:hypothetical protein